MDAPVHTRPAISLIAEGLGPHGSALYIGGSEGARDLGLLRRNGITAVVNCAINLDINYVEVPSDKADGERRASGFAAIRYYKIGMIDDEGSPDTMILGAYYVLDGALRQSMPSGPPIRSGTAVTFSSTAAADEAVPSRSSHSSCTSSNRTFTRRLTMPWRRSARAGN